ncbi:MAG: hypothetical protein HS110_07925 [Zoogloeaceae bacterium]|nr:hypothetical protein [Zoogloeaceae bacterium]
MQPSMSSAIRRMISKRSAAGAPTACSAGSSHGPAAGRPNASAGDGRGIG